jgi:monofunctional biosynthetic peptidoglycan transglycosylase
VTTRTRRAAGLLLRVAAAVVLVTVLLVLPLRWLPPLTSSFMLQNWFGQASLRARVHYDWVPRAAISREAARAVIAAEDQKFFDHPGFDIDAIRKAVRSNARSRQVRGASTISQQVAKNLWLWPGRSWFRKGLEAWFTLWVEWLWPKERILEVYLNIAQFGPDVYGVEAAGQRYFGKPAARLNRAEAARLAAVLPNPRRFRVARPSPYVLRRQAWIQRQARNLADDLPVGVFGRR